MLEDINIDEISYQQLQVTLRELAEDLRDGFTTETKVREYVKWLIPDEEQRRRYLCNIGLEA